MIYFFFNILNLNKGFVGFNLFISYHLKNNVKKWEYCIKT